MNKLLKYTLGVLICFQWSCSKEDQFQSHIVLANESTFVVNSVTSLIEYADDVMSYSLKVGNSNSTLVPEKAKLSFSDSIFWDWDGVNCIVDFGNNPDRGVVCKDNRIRSGRFRVNMRFSYDNKDNKISIIINNNDNYFVYNEGERWRVSGIINLNRLDDYTWFYETSGFTFDKNGQAVKTEIAGYLNKWNDNEPGLADDNFEITATGEISSLSDYSFSTNFDEPLIKHIKLGCYSNFNLGKMYIKDENGGESIIDYDPFNDEDCDSYAKLLLGSKEDLFFIP